MGEILPGNFKRREIGEPISPFKKNSVTENGFRGESVFSPNGVVEYKSGVKPRNEDRMVQNVVVHVEPMEKTIFQIDPLLKNASIPEEMAELTAQLSYTQLIEIMTESGMEEWISQPLWYLALIQEARIRDLDQEY